MGAKTYISGDDAAVSNADGAHSGVGAIADTGAQASSHTCAATGKDAGAPVDASASQIGATMEALFATINARKGADADAGSYTKSLFDGKLDNLLKKVSEESLESCLAAKECEMLKGNACELDEGVDHLRYEAADVIYHLLVLLARFDVPLDELAAELNMRMCEDERPKGCVMLHPDHVRRGK